MRIRDWRFVFLFLLACCAVEFSLAASNKTTPLFNHDDPKINREFQNIYQVSGRSTAIFTGAGAPGFTPQKAGDIYISTTTQKIYISTAIATPTSWVIVN